MSVLKWKGQRYLVTRSQKGRT